VYAIMTAAAALVTGKFGLAAAIFRGFRDLLREER
jgi:hypothetical protein